MLRIVTTDPRFYRHRRTGQTPPTKDDMDAAECAIWHRYGKVLVSPDQLDADGHWVVALELRGRAERRWGKRSG